MPDLAHPIRRAACAYAGALLALCASATLVSDDSKMFFSGGGWLPDAVPASAYYDITNTVSYSPWAFSDVPDGVTLHLNWLDGRDAWEVVIDSDTSELFWYTWDDYIYSPAYATNVSGTLARSDFETATTITATFHATRTGTPVFDPPKELRVTTNVSAAVVSLSSALLERWEMMGAEGVDPRPASDEDIYTLFYFYPNFPSVQATKVKARRFADVAWHFKTNVLRDSCPIEWAIQGTNRVINTLRIAPSRMVTSVRDSLRSSDGWGFWGGEMAYYGKLGSTLLEDNESGYDPDFPAFEWTSSMSVPDILMDAAWVWPAFTSCVTDGVWRLDYAGGYNADHANLANFVARFPQYDYYGNEIYSDAIIDWIGGAHIPVTAFSILQNRFGEHAYAFTNSTLRLSYYDLGTLEWALASIDTSYYNSGDCGGPDFVFVQDDHRHERGAATGRVTLSGTIDTDTGTLDISGALASTTWENYDRWDTTNNLTSSRYSPLFFCSGDTPRQTGMVDASQEMNISYQTLVDWWNYVKSLHSELSYCHVIPDPNASSLYNLEFLNSAYDSEGNLLDWSSITIPVASSNWTVVASVGVHRSTSVWNTLSSFVTNVPVHFVTYPSSVAWSSGIVRSAQVHTAESRVAATNCTFHIEESGTSMYFDGGGSTTDEWRSRNLGALGSFNALAAAGITARQTHRTAVKSCLYKDIASREALIPIPAADVTVLKNAAIGASQALEMETVPKAQIKYHVDSDGNVAGEKLDLNSGIRSEIVVRPGGKVTVGDSGAAFDAYSVTNQTLSVTNLMSFGAKGSIGHGMRVRWQFKDIRRTSP